MAASHGDKILEILKIQAYKAIKKMRGERFERSNSYENRP